MNDFMRVDAKARLIASRPWGVYALPQLVTEEHTSRWFEDFYMLKQEKKLFEHNGHSIFGYAQAHGGDPTKFFVALDTSGSPVYINEVEPIRAQFADPSNPAAHLFHGMHVWKQSSVAFSRDADRTALKGLATKIFWDYLATGKNIAMTDSQQTLSGRDLWRKLLHSGCGYLVASVSSNYTNDLVEIVSCGNRFEDANHFQYDAKRIWNETDNSRLIRVFIRRHI